MDVDGKKLRVGFQDLTIEVRDADFRTDNLTDCYGHYLQRENKIQINKNLEPHDLLNTVLHECLHACCYVGGLTTKSNPLSDEDKEKLQRIREVIDMEIRPYLQGDGGDLHIVGLEQNYLQVHYQGACGSCPSSLTGTLSGIQYLVQRIDPNLEVVAV